MSGECRGVPLKPRPFRRSDSVCNHPGRVYNHFGGGEWSPRAIRAGQWEWTWPVVGLIDLGCRASSPKARGDKYRVSGADSVQTTVGFSLNWNKGILSDDRSFPTEEGVPIIPGLSVYIGRNQK
jgi:hypothetical protein